MKSFACKDVGVGCDYKATGQSDDEVINQASEHAKEKHGIKDMTQDMLAKIKNAIHDMKNEFKGDKKDKDANAA